MRGTGRARGSALDKFHFLQLQEAKLTSRRSVIRASDWVSAKAQPGNKLPLVGEPLCFSGEKHRSAHGVKRKKEPKMGHKEKIKVKINLR